MALHVLSLFTLYVLVNFTLAQEFIVPPYWRKPTSTYTRQELLRRIDGVLNTITRSLNVTDGQFIGLQQLQSASMISALSVGDSINGSRTNEELVSNSLSTVFRATPDISGPQTSDNNDSPAIWGLAALDAYKAYHNPQFLDYANSMWTQLSDYVVTPDQAALNLTTHPTRTTPFPGSCSQISNAGAVFYLSGNTDDTSVHGQSTAVFMALSAHLYEQTLDQQYMTAAMLSADFVVNQLTNGHVILNSMLLGTCEKATTSFWTSDSAYAIYGLNVLSSNNASYAPRLAQLMSTVVPDQQWTNSSDGVNIEATPDAKHARFNDPHVALKGIFIRSLYQAYARVDSGSPQGVMLRSYINVQLNALLDLATVAGTNQYSPRWEGPPPSSLLSQGQLAAIDVLYSSLGLVASQSLDNQTNSPPDVNPTGVSQPTYNAHRIAPAAIGGIVAGVTALLLAIVATLLIIRRRSLQNDLLASMETTACPYTSPVVDQQTARSSEYSSSPLAIPPSKRLRDCLPSIQTTEATPRFTGWDAHAAGPTMSSTPLLNGAQGAGYPAGARPHIVDLVASPALIDYLARFIPHDSTDGHVESEPPRYVR